MKNGLYLLAVLFLAACTNDNKQTTEQQDTTVAELTYWDSIQEYDPQKMNLVIDGKQMELVYFKQNEDMVFKALEIEKSDNPQSYSSIFLYDITNDGVKDSIVWNVYPSDTGYIGRMTIKAYNKQVFSDSIIADSMMELDIYSTWWQGDSAYQYLKPYSTIASLAINEPNEEMIEVIDLKKNTGTISSSNYVSEKYKDSSQIYQTIKTQLLNEYINNYKGRAITKTILWQEGTLIWLPQDSVMLKF